MTSLEYMFLSDNSLEYCPNASQYEENSTKNILPSDSTNSYMYMMISWKG